MSAMAIAVDHLDGIPDGDSRGFDPLKEGRDTVLVVRKGDRLYAYRDACPHHGGTPMAWRKNAYLNGDRSKIVCHAHGAQFDIATGVCTLGPCLGQALESVPVVLLGDGEVRLVLNQP